MNDVAMPASPALATTPPAEPANDAQVTPTPLAMAATNDDPVAEDYGIRDHRYIQRLKRLQDLQDFLIAETIKVADADAILPGNLNLLVFEERGRMPTKRDWADLETSTQKLFGYMNGDLRRKFLLGQAPRLIAWIPVAFLSLALASLLAALYLKFPPFICYLAWLISLGAIGAVAFISVNTLSIQTTATFDINNRRLIAVRVVLGALFAVVLSIAFGYPSFLLFLIQITNASTTAEVGSQLLQHSLLLLLPFILGFSTTLVIAVLNRLVQSVGIFFGDQTPATGSPNVNGKSLP